MARAAKDAAEVAAVAEAEKENTTKANGATLKTGVMVRRPLLMAKATGAEKATGVEKAIGDIGARCSLLSILRQCRLGKAKAGLRLQVHVLGQHNHAEERQLPSGVTRAGGAHKASSSEFIEIEDSIQGLHYVVQFGDSAVFFEHVMPNASASSHGLRFLYRNRAAADATCKWPRLTITQRIERGLNQASDDLSNGKITEFKEEIYKLLGANVVFEQLSISTQQASVHDLIDWKLSCAQKDDAQQKRKQKKQLKPTPKRARGSKLAASASPSKS